MSRKKILAISGSTRKQSSNEKILAFVAKSYSELLEVDLYAELAQLPHFTSDADESHLPNSVQNLRDRIEWADGVLFCSPEYVFSLPGSLKNAIEWTVSTTLFANKPVGIIIAATSGEKALESLHLIMTTLESIVNEKSTLVIKGVRGKIDEYRDITDPTIKDKIETVVQSLLATIDEKAASVGDGLV